MKRVLHNKSIAILTIVLTFMIFRGDMLSHASEDLKNLYKSRDYWIPTTGTDLNVSHYIYHDLNNNGVYDIEDSSFMKIAVKMTRPDGSYVIKMSNLNGFVNFTNSLDSSSVDVNEEGTYTFEVIAPSGWKITSGNSIQKVTYEESKTKRSNLIADKVPTPVGLIQEAKITGKLKRKDNNKIINVSREEIEIEAVSPSGLKHKLDIDDQGVFSIFGEYGSWKITIKDIKESKLHEKEVELHTIPVKMSTIILGDEEISKKSDTRLIDFEDITYSTIQKIPNGIGNVNWTNLVVTDNLIYNGEGYKNNTISGKYVGYNTSGYPVTIYKDEGFDFYGGYFGVAWLNEAEGETLRVKVWRGDKLISEEDFTLSALGPFWFNADYRNITKLEISTDHYWQFVVDDILLGVD